MKYKLQRFFRNFAIENLLTYVAATMAIIFVGDLLAEGRLLPLLSFDRAAILRGEIWRVVTFLFFPQVGSATDPINSVWIVFSVYFYYFVGKTVEAEWGSHNLTMYFFTGALLLIVNGFVTGIAISSYLYFSLFLVYAYLNPRHKLLVFMIIPIEVRWIALVDIIFMLKEFITAFMVYPIAPMIALGWQMSVLIGFITFGIFFGKTFADRFKNKRRHKKFMQEMNNTNMKIKVVRTQRDEENEKDDK